MSTNNIEVIPVIYHDGLIASYAMMSNEELLKIACDADARNASVFGNLITLTVVEHKDKKCQN